MRNNPVQAIGSSIVWFPGVIEAVYGVTDGHADNADDIYYDVFMCDPNGFKVVTQVAPSTIRNPPGVKTWAARVGDLCWCVRVNEKIYFDIREQAAWHDCDGELIEYPAPEEE